jgi:hypothetical protein
LKKSSNITFQENPSVGGELFHADGRTDRHTDRPDEAKIRIPQFCETRLQYKQPSRTDDSRTEQVRAEPVGSLPAAAR